MNELLLPFLSFLIGIIVGLTGIGGASLITPMLIFVFQVPASVAVSSDIVAATLMKIFGGFSHWRQQTLDLTIVKWLAFGSVPGSLFGVEILHILRVSSGFDPDLFLLHAIGVMILFVTLAGLLQIALSTLAPEFQMASFPKLDLNTGLGRVGAIALGMVLGCMVGMTSVSSGSLFALVLIAFFQLDSRKLVGTDLAQAAILLFFTSLGHLSLGTVNWGIILPIWLGSIPGVLLGSKLCQIAPQRLLRVLIYALLIAVSWKLIFSNPI
ncbi:sulfite exporter TauE/SafE family protein [Tumidithrix helvetica PCC 7403]|uniref:sulfite exporter TauE/SafE family protein n=1 Tax=Tumidithrix helvetica TaxID=3457545 RepID=UPI003C80330F